MTESQLPTYIELGRRSDAPAGSSWGLLGDLGTIGLLTADRVRQAASCVVTGQVYNLDYPVNAFDPPPSATRRPTRHHVFQKRPTHRDDYLDSFYLQGTSQIDGLRHQGHPDHGFYNGAPAEELVAGKGPLGIDSWAEHGIVGRGVLLDVDRHLRARRGVGLDHATGESFAHELLDTVADAQGVELRRGDIVMLRTGWARYYFDEMTEAQRQSLPTALRCSGLAQSGAALAWLWDRGIALLAADNVAVEVVPSIAAQEFTKVSPDRRLHPPVIALLGMPLGELWRLDHLAEACARDGRYDMLVVASPLNLPGGVGSPANAVAIR
ncbi:cyclase family protein [Jiangella asiatica]|uniref:cyclase family protein n=1 Tax=Jiangella asiatica TaxID=2530372 RepID=UPI0013A5C43A|nr:cyclase family protein [Jiangella asiatica]